MKRCYLQKRFAKLFNILEWPYWLLHGIYELHCSIIVYEKNTSASIFKWLVTWKWGLPRSKFSLEILSPSPTLSYTITKKPKRVNSRRKSQWGSWRSCGSSLIELSIGVTVTVAFLFFINSILFRVSDSVLFESTQSLFHDSQ